MRRTYKRRVIPTRSSALRVCAGRDQMEEHPETAWHLTHRCPMYASPSLPSTRATCAAVKLGRRPGPGRKVRGADMVRGRQHRDSNGNGVASAFLAIRRAQAPDNTAIELALARARHRTETARLTTGD